MNNDFLTPENENKSTGPAPASEEFFAYNEIPDEVDVFDDSPVVTDAPEEAIPATDETEDVFDRPVCTTPTPAEDIPTPPAVCEPAEATENLCPTEPLSDNSTEDVAVYEEPAYNFSAQAEEISAVQPEIPTYSPAPEYTAVPVAPASSVQYYTPSVNPPVAPVSAQPVYTQPAPPVYTAPAQPQYTPPTAPAEQSPKPPKKKNGGSTAFLIILWVLVGLFATGFFGLCGYIIGTSGNNSADTTRPTLFEEETTAPATEEKDDDDSTPKATLPEAKPEPDNNNLYSDSTVIELKAPPADKNDALKYTTQYAYKKVANSTIGVVCYEEGFSDDPASEGTGIILSEDGYIATNSHVIGDSRSLYSVQVVTPDNQKYTAKVIGYDSRTDIAVLKIDAKGLTPAQFCSSEYLEVGQDVIAVGNPGGMGFQNSLTRGIVSALDRELDLSAQVSYIQTDAAINPGNSGGPLCNMYGQVVGINTAKISASSYEGMGFAIPSVLVKEIADDLISHGYVSDRVRLGISGQAVSSSMMQYYHIPTGILVGEIAEGGPCDGSGLQMNDVITAIDDEEVESFADVYGILAKHQPGDKVVLQVYRTSTGKELEINVTLMADEGETQQ